MGSVSLKLGDSSSTTRMICCSSSFLLNLLMLASLLCTNLFAFFAFTSTPTTHPTTLPRTPNTNNNDNFSTISSHVALIIREIESSQHRLRQIEREVAGFDTLDIFTSQNLPPELNLYLSPHPLPLGRDARSGLTHMSSSVSHHCGRRSPSAFALLSQYMSYTPYSFCPNSVNPVDLPHKLISKACEPLPRRRCRSRQLTGSLSINSRRFPLPRSLWDPSPLPNITISGLDKRKWTKPRSKTEFLIDDVLELGGGGIRIGFDIAGGAANFAARMAERSVTVVTSVLDNAGKPMNELVAARGLFPLLLSAAHRFPFFDGVFDLAHVGGALDEGGAPAMGQAAISEALEFLLFDVDRVLRVGGLLWIDNYLCASDERRRMVVKLIERFGYKKLKWVVGEKVEATSTQVYLSAVLKKPAARG